MDLRGVPVVVTGGVSGLGLATARTVAERGALVTLLDREAASEEVLASVPGATYAACDVTDADQVSAALDVAESTHGPLRGLVHCAGRGGDRLRILDKEGRPADPSSFREVVDVNLFGTYNVLRLGAERIARTDPVAGERGAIVLTASVAAFDGQIGQISYTATKAAVHGMTLVAARDLASRLIRVNTIAPGVFETPMLGRLREDIRASLAAAVPHPSRLGEARDYGHLAASILENPYLNGETIRLDGAIRMPPR
jgi:NAD(P)-dependent dehydrogenase (short-subunit alcohol dehydrogenase family)